MNGYALPPEYEKDKDGKWDRRAENRGAFERQAAKER
jgi:hypothetical protein